MFIPLKYHKSSTFHYLSKMLIANLEVILVLTYGRPNTFFQMQLIRDPKQQLEMVGVPEEHLSGHAFHMYHLTSPDQTYKMNSLVSFSFFYMFLFLNCLLWKKCCRVSFEFQHNVCGRSIYAEGTVDAVLFLAKKVLILLLCLS